MVFLLLKCQRGLMSEFYDPRAPRPVVWGAPALRKGARLHGIPMILEETSDR